MTAPRVRVRLFAAFLMVLFMTGPFAAPAEEVVGDEAGPVPETVGPTDVTELEAFIDGIMAAHMPSRDIPAATIAVVRDGELFFAKGYGYADREKKTPVEPDTTLFRIASISKLFTWTAVMQLAERGQLDLDADINTYLKSFQIPATYPEPITMKHLLSHTPGFEEGALGYLIVKDEAKIVPLRESLAAHIPDRVRPPGTWFSYSNWGTALAGLIVEEISGLSFAEYVEKNIFEPLGMGHSTIREPLPEDLAPDLAVGYRRKNGLYEPGYFEFISNFGPAGALSSTATDMARFMIAHLQLGRFGDQRILEEATARQMQSRLYAPDPRLPGVDYGFLEWDVYGQHAIGHGGNLGYFNGELVLFPEQNVGIFVYYPTPGFQARLEFVEAFVKRYFPFEERALPEPPQDSAKRWKKYAGNYRFTRHNWSDLEKIFSLPRVVKVAPTASGTLMTAGVFEEPLHWVEVEPNLFRQVGGDMSIAFTEDENGKITHMSFSLVPLGPTYRIAWYASPTFNYVLLVVGLLLCVTTLVSAFRHRKARKEDPSRAKWAVRLAALVSALTLVFWLAVVIIVSSAGEDIFFGYPSSLTAALMLPILISVLTLGVAIYAVLIWKEGFWTRCRRLHYTLFAVFAVGLVWFYWYWNVLGVQYG